MFLMIIVIALLIGTIALSSNQSPSAIKVTHDLSRFQRPGRKSDKGRPQQNSK